MKLKLLTLVTAFLSLINCKPDGNKSSQIATYPDVKVVGAMKNVMWNGELGSRIDLDTIEKRKGLYGLGPENYLTGELLIVDGNSYLSRVTSDTTMNVEKSFKVSAPFFVYSYVNEWKKIRLPEKVKTMVDLEKFIDGETLNIKRPFAFKLKGEVAKAGIHILNLPKGTTVNTPDEAHQGQTNFYLKDINATILGFFSTEHKAIFTHHDSFIHMHLLTDDEMKMGHLDTLEISSMNLYLPLK